MYRSIILRIAVETHHLPEQSKQQTLFFIVLPIMQNRNCKHIQKSHFNYKFLMGILQTLILPSVVAYETCSIGIFYVHKCTVMIFTTKLWIRNKLVHLQWPDQIAMTGIWRSRPVHPQFAECPSLSSQIQHKIKSLLPSCVINKA